MRRGNAGDAAGKQRPRSLGGMDIVVIGGGMAGTRLAQALAPYEGARVGVIGEEPHRPYNRVLLAEVLAGRYGPETIALPGLALPGAATAAGPRRAVRIDRAARRVLCDDGSAVRYDRLVLATGSAAVLPPLRGLFGAGGQQLPYGVHTFRTLDDCLALAAATGEGARAVVVGGGPLGVSAAQALAARGAQVTLTHRAEHLMNRQLDAEAAELLREHLAVQGIAVRTASPAVALHSGPAPLPAVTGVETADGSLLAADVVVLACGARPRTGLASAAGLAVDRGIVVADDLRTSDPAVFAAGDCAQHAGTVHGSAAAARDQADVLAAVLAAEATARAGPAAHRPLPRGTPRYRGTRALTRLTLRGRPALAPPDPALPDPIPPAAPAPAFDIAAFGTPDAAPGDDVLRLADATQGSYRKVVVREDRLAGGMLVGDLGAVGVLGRAWEDDEPLPAGEPLLHLLTHDGGSGPWL